MSAQNSRPFTTSRSFVLWFSPSPYDSEHAEDGQFFEAEQIGRVEGAPDQDVAEVHTEQIPEDDVPSEHLEKD